MVMISILTHEGVPHPEAVDLRVAVEHASVDELVEDADDERRQDGDCSVSEEQRDRDAQNTLKKVRVQDSKRTWPENELLKLNCAREPDCGALDGPRSQ